MLKDNKIIKRNRRVKIFFDHRPKVLLLGNGLNQSFGGISWNNLLAELCGDETEACRRKVEQLKAHRLKDMPYPLRAIWATNDDIRGAIVRYSDKKAKELGKEKYKENPFFGTPVSVEYRNVLQKLLKAGFDDILTTNYSYELECAALNSSEITSYKVESLCVTLKDRIDTKYLLHSFNLIESGGIKNHIWHIHGEARKIDSMLLGHYYYSGLLARLKKESSELGNQYEKYQKEGRLLPMNSWVDAFILGDVIILGFGFDFSEMDLWWLLNRRKIEKAKKGSIVFYEPYSEKNEGKYELLKILGVRVEHLNTFLTRDEDKNIELYRQFYETVLTLITAQNI